MSLICACADPDCMANGCKRYHDLIKNPPGPMEVKPPHWTDPGLPGMVPKGWECPVCKRVWSPMAGGCAWCNSQKKQWDLRDGLDMDTEEGQQEFLKRLRGALYEVQEKDA